MSAQTEGYVGIVPSSEEKSGPGVNGKAEEPPHRPEENSMPHTHAYAGKLVHAL